MSKQRGVNLDTNRLFTTLAAGALFRRTCNDLFCPGQSRSGSLQSNPLAVHACDVPT
jgi:hypothetical protein